jgi:two-component system sensor histidine kinase RegB
MTDSKQTTSKDPAGAKPYGNGELHSSEPGLSLMSLMVPRWLAIVGQLIAVLLVKFGLGFDLALGACIAVILASVALNIGLTLRFPSTKRLSDREASYYLAFDMLQLTALLYFTGGLHNPFFILFLAPVAVSASSLSTRSTLILMTLGFTCVSFIGVAAEPLPWISGEEFELPGLYQLGLWVAIVLGLSFSAVYASRIAREAQRMSDALAATQYVLAREQRLSAVGGLAAAAAHELGTPLGTITLIAKELEEEFADNETVAEDIELLISQVHRCRDILSRLSTNPLVGDAVYDQMDLGSLLHEVVDQFPSSSVAVEVSIEEPPESSDAAGPMPTLVRRPEIIYGLGNFLNNAVDFAVAKVMITADWDGESVHIRIEDDGPGFAPRVLDQLGEPYLTSRLGKFQTGRGHDHEGLGLGIFIAKTLIERTGGKISFSNLSGDQHGAIVDIRWQEGMVG